MLVMTDFLEIHFVDRMLFSLDFISLQRSMLSLPRQEGTHLLSVLRRRKKEEGRREGRSGSAPKVSVDFGVPMQHQALFIGGVGFFFGRFDVRLVPSFWRFLGSCSCSCSFSGCVCCACVGGERAVEGSSACVNST